MASIVYTTFPAPLGNFRKELEQLIFGVAGDMVCYDDTLDLLNLIAIEFIFNLESGTAWGESTAN
eukprot:m.4831 g.4831  ORF g.4831 m.4831 type:complete len:65 (-) comp4398_c0_seq1:244-438(-)